MAHHPLKNSIKPCISVLSMKTKAPYIIISLVLASCSVGNRLDKLDRVRLSQPGRSIAKADTAASVLPDQISWKDSSGIEHIVTKAEKDSTTGEDITVVELNEVTITARSKNVPERFGKVNLDFVITVPKTLINNKWQVQLTPVAYQKKEKIELEKIFLSGADFVKQQKKGYAQYQAFISSIIPDSEYLKELFNLKGYNKAMAEIEEEFYQAWLNDFLVRDQWIDWSEKTNKRYAYFNHKMERNKSSIEGSNSILSVLPSFWLKRDLDSTYVPTRYKLFSGNNYNIKLKSISFNDSLKIAERYFDYKRLAENERKKEMLHDKFNEYVKFPIQPARLDTIIENANESFSYYYIQEVDANDDTKKIDLTIDGLVVTKEGNRKPLPESDTITYYISSMIQFLDYAPRYKKEIIYRKAAANITAYINYPTGKVLFDENFEKNEEEINKVLDAINKLTYTGELVLDSINMIATASPEGSAHTNLALSKLRAIELKRYLSKRTDDHAGIDTLIRPKWIGEDWSKLRQLIANEKDMANKNGVLDIISSNADLDTKEKQIRSAYPETYSLIRERFYPLTRAVNFEFYLHRRDMIKDFIYTTVLDSTYLGGIKLMECRKYKEALNILSEYNDYNTALCLMSLGYDQKALEILLSEKDSGNKFYLMAIIYTRLKREAEAIRAFISSVELDASKIYRGKLDPEINKLITTYKLNLSQYE